MEVYFKTTFVVSSYFGRISSKLAHMICYSGALSQLQPPVVDSKTNFNKKKKIKVYLPSALQGSLKL